ncbi:MAG TPA: PhzF family phenazine biosynthesis protein, partial [Flavisolibacter sp.]|nr:PhzF family phenazine biosynthesis protein [Flavisolibacter sp.]
MTISYFIIDTFTKKPFKGNPTAIFYTTAPIQTHIAQMVAKELNLPVTGFINKTGPENEKHT